MTPPRQGYVARQLGSLALCCVRTEAPMVLLRAAVWHNTALRLGVAPPLFVLHDLGLLLSVPRRALTIAEGGEGPLPSEVRGPRERYAALLHSLGESEIAERLAAFRLRDELLAVLLVKILGDVYHLWPEPAKLTGACDLPIDALAGSSSSTGTGAARPGGAADAVGPFSTGFLRFLVSGNQPLSVHTQLEQIDLDTVRLLGMFTPLGQHGQGTLQALAGAPQAGLAGATLDLLDLFQVFKSSEASDVVNFSLDLMPSVLETRRASGVQTFSADGYASIERQGHPDSLLPGELCQDDDLFEIKVAEGDLFYYGHEKQREEERRLQLLLLDASPSMRGLRQVFARGLALALSKKLALSGDDVMLRFFDGRLSDPARITRGGGDYAAPFLLSYRSDRGRNYGRVFRQLLGELGRLAPGRERDPDRRPGPGQGPGQGQQGPRQATVVYILTHGQCHIPLDVVQALSRVAFLYGIFIMPSAEVELDYLGLLHRHQVVREAILTSQKDRRDRALQIVEDAVKTRQRLKETPLQGHRAGLP